MQARAGCLLVIWVWPGRLYFFQDRHEKVPSVATCKRSILLCCEKPFTTLHLHRRYYGNDSLFLPFKCVKPLSVLFRKIALVLYKCEQLFFVVRVLKEARGMHDAIANGSQLANLRPERKALPRQAAQFFKKGHRPLQPAAAQILRAKRQLTGLVKKAANPQEASFQGYVDENNE